MCIWVAHSYSYITQCEYVVEEDRYLDLLMHGVRLG
jgi:hypothetical protein